MINRRHKKNKQTFFHSYLFLIIIFIIALLMVFSYIRIYYRNYQIQQEISQLEKQAKELEVQKLDLLERLDYVKSSLFIEKKAKTDLGMVKIGEQMAVIPQTNNGDKLSNGQIDINMITLNDINNYKKWWDLFMTN